MKACIKCATELNIIGIVSRSDMCPKCGSYIHCCKNCEFYEEGRHNHCREPRSDSVSDREGANFCDWYKIADKNTAAQKPSSEDARKNFDALFKK